MEIDDLAGSRYRAAIELFAEGHSLVFSGVGFRLLPSNTLECRVESSWQSESITEERAREDLDSVYRTLAFLENSAPGFAELVAGRHPFVVLFAGCGMSGIEICTESGGSISWKAGFPAHGAAQRAAALDGRE